MPVKAPDLEAVMASLHNRCRLSYAKAVSKDPREEDEHGFENYREVVAVFTFAEEKFGFGEVTIVVDPATGQHYIDGETMSRERIKKYLGWLVDSAIMDSEEDPERHRAFDAFMGRRCGDPNCPSKTV